MYLFGFWRLFFDCEVKESKGRGYEENDELKWEMGVWEEE